MKILPVQNKFNPSKVINLSRQDKNISFDVYKDIKSSNITFMAATQPKTYELNYSLNDLKKMTSKEKFTPFTMLKENAEVYEKLESSDKEALVHLIRAAEIFNAVQKRLDNIHNKEFEEYLNDRICKGDERAGLTKILYDGQMGIFGSNVAGENIVLAKGLSLPAGKGF